MKKKIVSVLLLMALLVLPFAAQAEVVWLVPDSDTRKMTKEECWTWTYESLGFIYNEIFARHGYHFIPGEKYDNYFRCMPWYTPNSNPDNQTACYPKLNDIEWYNYDLIKEVRKEMAAQKTTNPKGKSVWDNFSTGFDTLQGFSALSLKADQKLAVYSAPDVNAWRGANNKASVSTTGAVWCAGRENNWLLVMYETNGGSVRVGYIRISDLIEADGKALAVNQLKFAYTDAVVAETTALTDDPARCFSPIASLAAGTKVTYLSTYFNRYGWDYIETKVGGQVVRGFIKTGALDIAQSSDAEINANR